MWADCSELRQPSGGVVVQVHGTVGVVDELGSLSEWWSN